MIDFQTEPAKYRHWSLSFDGPIARLTMQVDEQAGLRDDYELKLNSYDLGVDIELYDAIQRLRFEHPEVKSVVIDSGREGVFCAGANIRMLAGATHQHKVNFCKFTNETRNSIEDASEFSGQRYISAIKGTAAGGGYELALATDHLILVDDGNASVSLPEVPLLAVLPGTGGLTRLVDKRMVRRDLADVFCTVEEGIRGKRAVEWKLVDEIAVSSKFESTVQERAEEFAQQSDRPSDGQGVSLTPLSLEISEDRLEYQNLSVEINRTDGYVTLTLKCNEDNPLETIQEMEQQGVDYWPLQLARELDHALLHLRTNEAEMGSLIFKTSGNSESVLKFDRFLKTHQDHWLVREITLFIKRVLKRIDYTSRSCFAFVEPGSCFVGFLAEILFAVDRSYMLIGQFEDDDRPEPKVKLTDFNFDGLPMGNGLSRLETRFLGDPDKLSESKDLIGEALDAEQMEEAGLVTYALDDIDWEDDTRFLLEERPSYSPDALTGLEANLRFAGPETLETKIFGRLSAWQNWIFQRPNAVGEAGALRSFGSGSRPTYDKKRV